MKECTIFHTGIGCSAGGVIKENKVYLLEKDNTLYFPEEMFLAREECEGGLIQFVVEGKWGFANIYTGEIIIEPVWDYAGPFYSGYAHVALSVQLEIHNGGYVEIKGEEGQHGYINTSGEIIIPLEYDYAEDIACINHRYFKVTKNGKYGLVDNRNKTIIPFQWDRLEIKLNNDLVFCAIQEACELYVGLEDRLLAAVFNAHPEPTCDHLFKWGVYDHNFNLIVQNELDQEPISPMIKSNRRSRTYNYCYEYYILKRGNKYGVLCKDGRWIANIELSKKQAEAVINNICEPELVGKLYI